MAQSFAPVRCDDDDMDSHTAFTCPITGQRVDHVFDRRDETPLVDQYEIVACPSCAEVHFINRLTGKLLKTQIERG
jgi:hypothetical protein